MNLWSEARILADSPQPNSEGARRRVGIRVFGVTLWLDETVRHSEPPHRFVYEVHGSALIRGHRGTIELTPVDSGTHVTWCVRFESPVPGLAFVLAAILRPSLERSLERDQQ